MSELSSPAVSAAWGSTISSGASVLGNVSNVVSTRRNARYQADTAALSARIEQNNWLHQANVAEHNARQMDFARRTVYDQAAHEAGRLTLQVGQLKGKQRAALGASGVDLGVGSAVEVQASTEVMKEIDVNTIKTNAMLQAFGFENQARNYRNSAEMARLTAEGYDPKLARSLSLLSSAPMVAQSWMGLAGALTGFSSSWSNLGKARDQYKKDNKMAPVEEREINWLKPTSSYNPFPNLTAALHFNW
jgi:hypothetical protein